MSKNLAQPYTKNPRAAMAPGTESWHLTEEPTRERKG